MQTYYSTDSGFCMHGKAENLLNIESIKPYIGNVDLIFTSPPFPLNRKKKYGNLEGQDYVDWIANFASIFKKVLKPTGSIVIEIGNSWEKGRPTMSTLGLRALLAFLDAGDFHLCQQFIWHNPARLPSPVQWVNIERIRVKDAFTHIWWMSPTDRPKANNRNVLTEYSQAMKKLLKTQKYNAGKRPSEHDIGKSSFLNDNNGAIPPNVITLSNTSASSRYLQYCKKHSIEFHPARMPIDLPKFFINFLTDPGDIVLDPFAGSNTTGAAAHDTGRKWIAIEAKEEYIKGSQGYFFRESSTSMPLFSEG